MFYFNLIILLESIFFGVPVSVLMIKPYLKDMTSSEMFVAMTALYANVSGSSLSYFLRFGVSRACRSSSEYLD